MAANKTIDCCTLSLDEIIERRQLRPTHGGRPNDGKKFNPNGNNKMRKLVNKPAFKAATGMGGGGGGLPSDTPSASRSTYDARNKIIQKTRAKITDARDILNQNMRESGIDARQLLTERKKQIRPVSIEYSSDDAQGAIVNQGLARLMMERKKFPSNNSHHRQPMLGKYAPEDRGNRGGQEHIGQFGQRMVTMSNRPVGNIQQMCDYYSQPGNSSPPHAGRSYNSRLNPSAKPFAPRGYVDHDNMQHLEDEEIHSSVHLGGSNSNVPPPSRYGYANFNMNIDEDIEMSTSPLQNNIASDPFAIYETARNRIERPMLHAPQHIMARTDGGGGEQQLFDRCRRKLAATSNLSDSLRARLFGGEPDRRVSHGIYANENKGLANSSSNASPSLILSMSTRRSPPLGMSNNKKGYRLLVSNLHSNVTTSDIRELFNDIGPMYDAHVVRPGTAEVIFKSLEHAELAVDSYHHREFDGQPMHCVLINPHSSNRSAHPASSRTVTTNSSGVEVDIDALHSVLFRDR